MEFTIEDRRRYHDRSSDPYSYATRDIAEIHGLSRGSAGYRAFNLLWFAKGRWKTLEHLFDNPGIDRERFPREVEQFLFDEGNRVFLMKLFTQSKALFTLYDTNPETWH